MAKINYFLVEYKESISSITPLRRENQLPAPVIRRFVRIFTSIDDARYQG